MSKNYEIMIDEYNESTSSLMWEVMVTEISLGILFLLLVVGGAIYSIK